MEYTLMVYSPNGKGMVLWKIVFRNGNGHGINDKKRHHKRYNQNQFCALHEVDKSNVASSFWGIWSGLYFFAPFFFSLSLSIGKKLTLEKIWGGGAAAHSPAPQFLRACYFQKFSNIAFQNFTIDRLEKKTKWFSQSITKTSHGFLFPKYYGKRTQTCWNTAYLNKDTKDVFKLW